jgi:hypothetical protein
MIVVECMENLIHIAALSAKSHHNRWLKIRVLLKYMCICV